MTGPHSLLSGEELFARAERLREAVNESASLVRNLYFSFLLLGTYIAVTIGATSDEQLLKGDPVTLPIIDVDLPIFAFYSVIPWLLLLFHLNLLMQLYLLSRRIHLFNAAVDQLADAEEQHEQRIGLFPFPFVQMMAGDPTARFTRSLSALIVWVTIILLPLLLVLAAQVAFLPYHDIGMTWWQRLAVLLDVVVIWIFWPMIVTPVGQQVQLWWSRLWRGPIGLVRRIVRRREQNNAARGDVHTWGMLPMVIVTVPVLLFSTLVAVIPGEALERITVEALPEAWHSNVVKQSNALTHLLFDAPGAPMHRNLRLAGRIIVAGDLSPSMEVALRSPREEVRQEALADIVGVDLANRDLRFADLRGALIPKANLQGVNLDGVDLRQAELQGADLRPFDISNGGACVWPIQGVELRDEEAKATSGLLLPTGLARVCRVSLQNANMAEARLNGARMALADLMLADLRQAELGSADLRGARLVKANLSEAKLTNAKLVGADLSAAILERTRLDGADLTDAVLEGWRLDGVILDDAVFSRGASLARARISSMARVKLEEADLSHADLRGVKLDGALLRGANLDAAILDKAQMRGVNLANAQLRRARLVGADLRLSLLAGADLRGATLWDADLRGSYLLSALLHGANLQGANLELAMIREAEFTAADLAKARLGGAYFDSRLDLADLRRLSVVAPGEAEPKRLLELLSTLQTSTNYLPGALIRYLEQPNHRESFADDPLQGAQVDRTVLCDSDPVFIQPHQRRHCVNEDKISAYVGRLMSFACENVDVAYGIAQRAVHWTNRMWLARFYHRGKEPDDYPRLLAEGLLDPSCEAATKLPVATLEQLEALAAQSASDGE